MIDFVRKEGGKYGIQRQFFRLHPQRALCAAGGLDTDKNVSVNTSTITAKAYLVNDWSLSINARSDNKVTIDGTAQTYASPAISSTGTHLLGTVTQTVNHGSDGTKSLAMSAVFYIRATLSGTYYESITASANITLDSIARASTVSASNVEMGSATTIAISRASSSFTHTLTYAFGSATRDDCHKDHIHIRVLDAAPYAGRPDTEGGDGNRHDYLHHL
ncbi:MAG: DUF859 family phage minor structural protein [Blautia massiliensis (ex Durand et al. 2017)]